MLLAQRAPCWYGLRLRASAAMSSSGGAPVAAGVPAKIVLDREAFKEVVKLPALRVPKQRCNEMIKRFRG